MSGSAAPNITQPLAFATAPIADPITGLVTHGWLQFFLTIQTRTGGNAGVNTTILQTIVDNNSGSIAGLQSEISLLQTQVGTLQTQVGDLQTAVTVLQSAVADLSNGLELVVDPLSLR